MNGKVFCGLLGWLHPHEVPQYGIMKEFKPTGVKMQNCIGCKNQSVDILCHECIQENPKIGKQMKEQEHLDMSWELETAKSCIKIQKQTINHLNALIDRYETILVGYENRKEDNKEFIKLFSEVFK
jgi:hypothetical protein